MHFLSSEILQAGTVKGSITLSYKVCEDRSILIVRGPGVETLSLGDNDFWIAQYMSFQYLLVCKMNYSAFRDYLRWYLAV